ncbi:skin secretory protein xP2-like isoform X2 [Amphibalanus amphitrite]|uniref:skin secretory protein xP2-like isoform X2 n=1 Tax=Amphibalanus amphitrite TaxID=1232801 RepID=UPI001C91FABD|nr:skin secretory protein xP2-like isoform X2 [Amphibalanus amphitrite]XP_043218106.1 skin secretory protein xP2-like isoform X2 [Amphibalanus amphitrite]
MKADTQQLMLCLTMDVTERQMCPRCSVPGGEQHPMKRLKINFTESVDMCPNQKCLWVRLVCTDAGADGQVPLPGGLSSLPGAGGVDYMDDLDVLLNEPSDSGVDVDGSDRSVASWEPAASEAGSLSSELAAVALSSVPSAAVSEPGRWRPVSAPGRAPSTAGSLLTETRSEPDPAALRRMARHGRQTEPRPLSGLSLSNFGDKETRPENWVEKPKPTMPPSTRRRAGAPSETGLFSSPSGRAVFRRPALPAWERAALRQTVAGSDPWALLSGWDGAARSRRLSAAAKKLKRAERMEEAARKVAAPARSPVSPSSTITAIAGPSAAAPALPVASSSRTAAGAAPVPAGAPTAAGASAPGPRTAEGAATPRSNLHCPARTDRNGSAAVKDTASRMNTMLAAPELYKRLCTTFNTEQVFVRSRNVERVRAWAKRKAAGTEPEV